MSEIVPLALANSFEECLIDSDDYLKVCEYNWRISEDGYVQTWKKGKRILLHQFITGWFCPDHIDGNKLNNSKSNLRKSNYQLNAANRSKIIKPTSSKYKGVHFFKQTNQWMARIGFNGKRIHIGMFSHEKDAALAYNEKAIELFGEFAKLNDVC